VETLPESYTLPELSKLLGVQYRTLHSWVERGLLQPRLRQSTGTGVPNLFDGRDAVIACVLADFRAAGVSLALMGQAADRLRETDDALEREAFMLVNGDVKIVFNAEEATDALRCGGLTLAYNTAAALETVAGARLNQTPAPVQSLVGLSSDSI
jgi:DNA-binding transcriptional MerR regulator